MKIKMDSLIITEYCSTDKRKYRFIKEISQDPLIIQFVSPNIEEYLEKSENIEDLMIGHTYIIADERKLVGLIKLASLKEGILNLYYATHPDYRKNEKHYGSKILKETSKYLLKNLKEVNQIELRIKEINKGSIKCAEKAGFKLTKEKNSKIDSKIMIYRMNK